MLKVLVLLVCLEVALSEKVRFDNYSVYGIRLTSEEQLAAAKELYEYKHGLYFWGRPKYPNSTFNVLVPPHKKRDFLDFLQITKIEERLLVPDLQAKFDKQVLKKEDVFGWRSFYNLTEIYTWLDSLVEQYPEASLEVGGHSYEGREIRGIKVSYGPNKPAVFIEAGIHANEWLGPATATYILNQVLNSSDPEVRAVVEEYDWYVFPSFNPDGFEYTHTTDRTWRKTRSGSGLSCRGVDLNRNWDFHWNDGGTSNISCASFFSGVSPFSEKEAGTLQEYLSRISHEIKVYLAFHTYSQMILLPYGHTKERVSNYDELMRIGNRAAEKLKQRHGTVYEVGNIVDILYVASGGSADWMKGTFDTPVVFTLELRDTGEHGYYIPVEQIIPTGEETFDAVLSILQDARDLPFTPTRRATAKP